MWLRHGGSRCGVLAVLRCEPDVEVIEDRPCFCPALMRRVNFLQVVKKPSQGLLDDARLGLAGVPRPEEAWTPAHSMDRNTDGRPWVRLG